MLKKRQASAITLIVTLLFLGVAGTQLAKEGKANPYAQDPRPYVSLPRSPPQISVLSPTNITYPQNNVLLHFIVTLPEPESQVFCAVDYLLLSESDVKSCYYRDFVSDSKDDVTNLPASLNYTINLTELSEGAHTLRILASSRSYATYASIRTWSGFAIETKTVFSNGFASNWYDVNFTVDTVAPKITIHSPLNTIYQQTDIIALNFTANEPTTLLTYTLDGQENVTIAQNSTLTGLLGGEHNVTVYGWDEAGNVGASETKYFSIAEPAPDPFPTAYVVTASASVATVAVVGVGLLVYFKKRKH